MSNNPLKIIANSDSLFKALEELLYKQAVKAKLDGSTLVEGVLREIEGMKEHAEKVEESNPAR